MHRTLTLVFGVAVILFGIAVQAQAQFTMNAASDDAVPGWQKMEIEGRSVWVNPTPALTAADIEGAQPGTDRNYGQFVGVIFTDEGAKKMRDLSTAQMNKLIAMMLDGKILMASKVRSVINKDMVVSGKPPGGLTTDEVRRILTSVNQKRK